MEETITRTLDDLTGDILVVSKHVSMLLIIDGEEQRLNWILSRRFWTRCYPHSVTTITRRFAGYS